MKRALIILAVSHRLTPFNPARDSALRRKKELYTDPKTDDATLLAKRKEMRKLHQQLSDKNAQMKIEWCKILTCDEVS